MTTTIEGNYLVFETDHFSLYAIVGDQKALRIASLPNNLHYKKGDILNTNGLTLDLGDETVSTGFVCEPTVFSNCGEQVITVQYNGLITSFTIVVDHTYDKKTIAPSCTETGSITYTCYCGETYTETIEANGHTDSDWIIDSYSTCAKEGSKHIECTVCGETVKTESIAKLPHDYNSVVTEATCEKDGYTTFTCVCGDTYTGDKTPAKDHDYVEGVCKNCGDSKIDNCSCNCHKSGLMGIIWKILRFFYKLFKINPVCGCGVSHY